MKFLNFAVVFILTFLCYSVKSDCDSEVKNFYEIRGCLETFFEKLNMKQHPNIFIKDSENKTMIKPEIFCSALNEKEACFGKIDKNCQNFKEYSKILGLSPALTYLSFDMFTHYICTHDFETTLKGMECNKEIKKEEKCPSIPRSKNVQDICKFISNRRSCIKDAMIQKCGNKKLAQFYFDVEIEISKIVMPLCFTT